MAPPVFLFPARRRGGYDRRMKRLLVAPHLDDGAISFGGTLLAERAAGGAVRTTVATVMTRSVFTKAGIGDLEEVSATRRREERAAMGAMGVDVIFLGFGECLPRGYTIRDVLDYPRQIDPQLDTHTVADIAAQLGPVFRAHDEVLIPLAVGEQAHVDHRIVRLAAAAAARDMPALPLGLYEDVPYIDGAMRTRVSALGALTLQEQRIDLDAKFALCRCYSSQPVEAWLPAIRDAAGDAPIERRWVVNDRDIFEVLARW